MLAAQKHSQLVILMDPKDTTTVGSAALETIEHDPTSRVVAYKVRSMECQGEWHFEANPMNNNKALQSKIIVLMRGRQNQCRMDGKLSHTAHKLLGPR